MADTVVTPRCWCGAYKARRYTRPQVTGYVCVGCGHVRLVRHTIEHPPPIFSHRP